MKPFILSSLFLGCAVAQCPLSNISASYDMGRGAGVTWFRGVTFTNAASKTIVGIKFSTGWVDAVADIHADLEMGTSDETVKPGKTKTVHMGDQ